MKIDLFPTTVRKYHISDNDMFLTHWTKEYDECKFKEISPLIMGYDDIGHDLTLPYVDVLNEFMIDLGINETHSFSLQAFVFKCLEKGESVDKGDFLPSHYTMVHYLNECKKSDSFFHPIRQLVQSFDPVNVPEWIWDAGLYVNAGDILIYPSYLETASPRNELTDPRMTVTVPIVLKPNEQGRKPSN